MSYTAEGCIEIDLDEFFYWVKQNYCPSKHGIYRMGVPRANKSNKVLEIDFAMSDSDNDPAQWTVKPNAILQWEQLND